MEKIFSSLLIFTFTVFTSFTSFAAAVKKASIDERGENIILDVQYAGGCGSHEFSLQINRCLESFPVQCEALLIEDTKDSCKALISTTVAINLKTEGLDGAYYEQAYLTIKGDKNTSVQVQLP